MFERDAVLADQEPDLAAQVRTMLAADAGGDGFLRRGAERLDAELGEEPRARAALQQEIANVYMVWELPKQAELLLEAALEVGAVDGAPPDAGLLSAWADWSNVSQSLGRYEDAATFAQRALSLYWPKVECSISSWR